MECPECGTGKFRICRCQLGNMLCENGHEWMICPTHKDKILVGGENTDKFHKDSKASCENKCVHLSKQRLKVGDPH